MKKDEGNNLLPRPPIIVVMGHVDHGKTTLLDYIRQTNVAIKEAGGITQSIGAYEIEHSGKKITFIDTPGHEAFSKMRARGTQVADLAILVVAADEGVKPQTKEALGHIQAAKLPFIVAINKIDKPDVNLDRVKNELMTAGILLEGYGGNVSWQAVSAKTGQGVSELLDLILLAAELENLKYEPAGQTQGVIIEVHLDSRRGIVASVIVKNGILRVGQGIATPTAGGKIKSLENFLGKKADSLEPSSPALLLGFDSLPQVGEEFLAREVKLGIIEEMPLVTVKRPLTVPLEDSQKLKVILKADNTGSLEVLDDIIKNLPSTKSLEILEKGIGKINENNLKLALTTQALVIGFKVDLDKAAENLKNIHNIKVITSEIIYELLKELEDYLTLLKKTANLQAELEVLAVFGVPEKNKQIIGGRITKGPIKNQQKFEVWRKEQSFTQGRILNLQEQRKDVPEAEAGKEVGLLIEADDIIKVGDKLKVFV